MHIQDLDGFYRITYSADRPEISFFTEAFGVVMAGMIMGLDVGGCRWIGAWRIDGEDVVADIMIDPTGAPPATFLVDPQGESVRHPLRYVSRFRPVMSGYPLILDADVQHGALTYQVVMTRLRVIP